MWNMNTRARRRRCAAVSGVISCETGNGKQGYQGRKSINKKYTNIQHFIDA